MAGSWRRGADPFGGAGGHRLPGMSGVEGCASCARCAVTARRVLTIRRRRADFRRAPAPACGYPLKKTPPDKWAAAGVLAGAHRCRRIARRVLRLFGKSDRRRPTRPDAARTGAELPVGGQRRARQGAMSQHDQLSHAEYLRKGCGIRIGSGGESPAAATGTQRAAPPVRLTKNRRANLNQI